MFTGIVQHVGVVRRAEGAAASALRLWVDLGPLAQRVAVGDSVCIDGVCLSATGIRATEACFDAGAETLRLTTLRDVRPGRRVNLELALPAGAPMGGHIVQGHVDGTGAVVSIRRDAGGSLFGFSAPADLLEQMVLKGSVAVDGISLTVSVLAEGRFEVYAIPHTLAHTTLRERREGDAVNIETDVIGKYVARILQRAGVREGVTERLLREHGFE